MNHMVKYQKIIYLFHIPVLDDFTRNVGASSKFISGSLGREHLFKYLPSSQAELPPRRMSVSLY